MGIQANRIQDIPALLLVGGLGTRLRSQVPSKPKPLASIGDQPFLRLLVKQLRHQKVRRAIMCTGYLAEEIEREFGDGSAWDMTIEYSKEEIPLGTAGATKLAARRIEGTSAFVVMNGDSFLDFHLESLVRFHRAAGALVSIAVVQVENAGRFGTVTVESDGRIIGFTEKSGSDSPGLINGGVYMIDSSILELIPEGPASLEREVFPRLVGHGLYGVKQQGVFIDIGTPEDFARAQQMCNRLRDAAESPLHWIG